MPSFGYLVQLILIIAIIVLLFASAFGQSNKYVDLFKFAMALWAVKTFFSMLPYH